MGAAAYIGRVGGLAVALGVGTAIATGQGVAAADDAPATPPSADTTDASTGGATDTKAPATTTDTKASNEPSTPEPDKPSTSAGTTTTTVKDGTVVSAQTNTGTTATTGTTTEPTQAAEPTTEPTQSAEPTQAPATETPEETPKPKPTAVKKASTKTSEESTTSVAAHTVRSVADPTAALESTDPVAVFADARTLAAASPTRISPMMAAQVTSVDTTQPAVTTAPESPLTAVTKLVSNVLGFVLNPLAGNMPTTPAQPPLIWSLLAFARKEFDNFFAVLAGATADTASPVARLTSLALASINNPIPPRPAFPAPGQQLSTSTNFVDWVTGNFLPNNTSQRFSIWGTDVGTMWDNGIPDDPSTPYNEHQILIAVGDTFSGANMTGDWRSNTILRSGDTLLVDGMSIPDGEWFNGNMFGGAPLSSPTTARQVIFPGKLPAGVTLIPTAGISLPTPGTRFGATQYMSFMSVKQWGNPGSWTTNYSAIAYSTDNGENWTVAPTSVRYNQSWSGNKNFQQAAFVLGNDGYVYAYGTPNGRQGAAYVSRVLPKDILDTTKYEYYSKGTKSWFSSTPAGWYKNDPGKATPVFGKEGGACGVASAGNTVSEMSVQFNKTLNKYVVLYGDQFNNIVIRTSDSPQGAWSTAKTILTQQNGGIYAPMMHPWSPSTMGTGTDLYWNLSLWSQYNVMLMRTDLTKV
ncbi:hypothetical protein GGC64_004032 [Mycobacterium sp. OAS707]|uniref:DUF4185 domain-containing protein n=1 Tax=Mycobacterium sp. OAS707 TaxID=2663822 RepID=UPI00178B894F|nr:DUF4185 domain-containing protein [Mycobacterium sp. OAS707]MBE1549992.1 hypothetical protein [Mycobacterium sp. OAS707]